MFASLRDFIVHLEKTGELVRVSAPVSPYLEMTEIGDRLIKQGGPAVLFENVAGLTPEQRSGFQLPENYTWPQSYSIPVLANLFGTVDRVAAGMGRKKEDLRELGEMLAFLRQPQPPGSLKEAWDMRPILKQAMAMKPKTVSKAPCQQVIYRDDEVDLGMLPIQSCWPNEPAPLITWPLVVTKGVSKDKERAKEGESALSTPHEARSSRAPEANYNLGIYRMQVLNKNQTLMRWLKHRGGAQHYRGWQAKKREPMPCAVVIGCDPGTTLAAVTPVPDTLSEYQFAGLLRRKKLELVDCVTVPLQVPAEAEIVLEGHISLDDQRDEGPYGDHTGYYNSVEQFPVFTVSAITMRKDPIYHSTYTGKPPDEPSVLGEALNEVFIPLLQQQFPEITDFWLPPEGCSYRVAVVSMKKSYPGHAKRVMMGVWSYLRQFMYTKWVVVVDDDINARDWKEVIWAISTRMDPARDITLVEHTPIDYLDFASPLSGLGSKIGLDATNKWSPETKREWGQLIEMDKKTREKVEKRWREYGFK